MELIGVVGAGAMGVGVAQSFAENGFKVVLLDISEVLIRQT
jgi:3-hydroxyacyl-CoA dehydrogenase